MYILRFLRLKYILIKTTIKTIIPHLFILISHIIIIYNNINILLFIYIKMPM